MNKFPENSIFISVHHKCGTAWLHDIFIRVCEEFNVTLIHTDNLPSIDLISPYNQVIFDSSGKFNTSFLPDIKGVHLIRDPRDVIVSATNYHCKGLETWLHTPIPDWDGLSYMQKILSYPSFDERLNFEMQFSSYHVLKDIQNWNYDDPCFYQARYENLMTDPSMKEFKNIFSFLGFSSKELEFALKVAYDRSLFNKKELPPHVHSGAPNQWSTSFKKSHGLKFIELFGNLLQQLKYENSNQWVDALQC